MGVSNIKLPLGFYITAFADWNMVSAFQEMVSFSMNIEFILQWYSPLKIGKNPVYIKSRTAYTGMYYSNDVGSDNTILTSLSIGVSFNEER